ncbi:hypothetical protein [Odoribacter lunatus]|uniref:hypothetical protein n=1 Tax=Odoribacter lunatus TaxID=2941335 RepID=UPI00203EDD07|nr:hypothetical protein [Odoribacter lunatus]
MITFFIIVLFLIGIALIALGIGLFFHRDFPDTHISRNKHMRDRGITCANSTDANERQNYKPIDNR